MGKTKKARSSRAAEEVSGAQGSPEPTKATKSTEQPSADTNDGSPETQPSHVPASAEDFEALYLRRVTAEFADDLETLRQAKDFDDASVPMLVQALRDGAALYSPDQQARLAESFRRAEEKAKK